MECKVTKAVRVAYLRSLIVGWEILGRLKLVSRKCPSAEFFRQVWADTGVAWCCIKHTFSSTQGEQAQTTLRADSRAAESKPNWKQSSGKTAFPLDSPLEQSTQFHTQQNTDAHKIQQRIWTLQSQQIGNRFISWSNFLSIYVSGNQ